jgi:DNA-binding response OmpR family regulator
MNFLVIEDDEKIGAFLARGLEQEGHHADWVKHGLDGLARARDRHHDALIVDLMLPGLDGTEIIRRLRSEKINTPILVLSARSSVEDRVAGLGVGADDYLTKPFSFAEVVARLHALVRRTTAAPEPATRLSYCDLTLDLLSRRATRADQTIDLQAKEFALLEYLMRNPERVLSKTMILSRVWDYAFDPQTNVVDVLVSRVRTKVDKGFDKKLIHTLRGVGYVLRQD